MIFNLAGGKSFYVLNVFCFINLSWKNKTLKTATEHIPSIISDVHARNLLTIEETNLYYSSNESGKHSDMSSCRVGTNFAG